MAPITFEHVTKRFDETTAVADLDIEVADGEFLVLVGPSGCGKTTALRMLAGLEDITSGRILIGDRVVNNIAPGARDVAMVFQSYALYPPSACATSVCRRPRSTGASGRRPTCWSWASSSRGSRGSFPAVSVSGSRSGGRSCGSRRGS